MNISIYEPKWVIENLLARSARPGRELGMDIDVPRDTVDEWLNKLRRMGVRSIICLLDDEHLIYYKDLSVQLVDYYWKAGFTVAHIPVRDPVSGGRFAESSLAETWQAFQKLPKPVLVHCSAGRDRTGKVIDYLLSKLRSGGDE